MRLPPNLAVLNAVDNDVRFLMTTGTPGSCSCEKPLCNLDPRTGTPLPHGETRRFQSNNCAYFSIGGGLADATGNPCAIWRADSNGACHFEPGGPTGECSRVGNLTCTISTNVATLTATIDQTCDVLPYAQCQPVSSLCCGEMNVCALAKPSKTYYMCQPRAPFSVRPSSLFLMEARRSLALTDHHLST